MSLRAFALKGLWPADREAASGAAEAQCPPCRGLAVDEPWGDVGPWPEGGGDSLAPAPARRRLLREPLHAGPNDEPDSSRDDGDEGAEFLGSRRRSMTEYSGAVCLNPGCGKPTWNGEPGEYCSVDCKEAVPPKCKKPGCPNLSFNAGEDEYCSMDCKNKSTVCLKRGCYKNTWNGRPKGFCSLVCFGEADTECMMQGCHKRTWNGRPAGFCTPDCRDQAKHMVAKKTLKKDGSMRDLDTHIARMVSGKITMMSRAEKESEETKIEAAKAGLMEATSGQDLLLRAEVLIQQNWLGKIEALPGNIYRIGAFGRLADLQRKTAHKTLGRVFGWVAVWLVQVVGPPAIWLSVVFAWGIQADMKFHWRNWDMELYDWHHIALTKTLALVFQICFVLNGLYVVMQNRDDWRKIHCIIRYMKHYNRDMNFGYRYFMYLGALTNCWVVLWCCADTVVVLGSSQSPKDVLFDSLGLLFLYNLDDIGGELGFVSDSDWPGARLGWIYSEMVAENWHLEEAGSRKTKESEFVEENQGAGGQFVMWVFNFTIWTLGVATVLYPAFNAVTPFLKIAPPDGGWP